tara:strand:+ start:24150 stop:24767 length:618 start_codon:yes stop_codon:yes gene_type:complete
MNSNVKVYDYLFDGQEDKLDYLYTFFKQCNSNWQFDYIKKEEIEKKQALNYKQYVYDIISTVVKQINYLEPSLIHGYEAWINTMPLDSKGLEYHFDCDEGQDVLVTPLKSIVIYIGPKRGMTGGSFVLDIFGATKQKEFSSIYEVKEDLDNGWIQIPFEYGRAVIFNPTIPHAVLPIKRMDPFESRITLTIAVWDKEPTIVRSSR